MKTHTSLFQPLFCLSLAALFACASHSTWSADATANVLQGAPPVVIPSTTLYGGVGVSLAASSGGKIILSIDGSRLSVSPGSLVCHTFFSPKLEEIVSNAPSFQYTEPGIYNATVRVNSNEDVNLRQIVILTIPIGNAELGLPALTSTSAALNTTSLKGKVDFFNQKSADSVTYVGTFGLPAGLKIGEAIDISFSIGNCVGTTTLQKSTKGKKAGVIKSVVLKSALKTGDTTVGGEPATLTVNFSGKAILEDIGFEGITLLSTDIFTPEHEPSKTPVTRNIQVAMLLAGVPYFTRVPVDFLVGKAFHSGSFVSK